MSFEPQEKGVPIRQPATANLVIDSADRNEAVNPNPFDFQISRPNSILNGFFTRIGTTEVVLEWNEPNGKYLSGLGDTQVLISTAGGFLSTTVGNNFGPALFYNTSNALDLFADGIGASFGGALVSSFSVSTISGLPAIVASAPVDAILVSTSAESLALGLGSQPTLDVVPTLDWIPIRAPDLRPYRYIDFTSAQLTYNQDLKDSSSADIVRDVLCRWYFAYDQPAPLDGYGFPIEMGYEPFKLRRLFNPPKQIKWDTRQPVGNLSFQVYGNGEYQVIQPANPPGNLGSEWLMTLQVSET